MIVTRKHLPRRTVLRGLGAAIALPLLDGMVPAFTPLRVSAAAPVRRFGAVYVGMGMNMNEWMQPAEGALRINSILEPVQRFADRMLVVSGLDSNEAYATDNGQHPRMQATWLTGSRAKKTYGADIHLGTSLDQIVAKEFGKDTQVGSLELAVESTVLAGDCAYGYSCAYNNTIAWRTPTTPLPMENNPRNVFERLFGASDSSDPQARLRDVGRNRSILDSVTGDVASLQRELGPSDNARLDEYLDAVRDIERRLTNAEGQVARDLPVVSRPTGIPASFEEHVKVMLDLQLVAFQTDLTRVFTFLMVRESSIRSYPEIGVPDSHHPLSHHQNNPEKLARQAKLNAYHLKMMGYFLDKLQATPDGDGSLFDHTLLLYGSGMSDSNLHLHKNVPTLLVAGKDYGIAGNRFLQYAEGTPLANLQLNVLERLGLPVEKFGDSNGRLSRLSGV